MPRPMYRSKGASDCMLVKVRTDPFLCVVCLLTLDAEYDTAWHTVGCQLSLHGQRGEAGSLCIRQW